MDAQRKMLGNLTKFLAANDRMDPWSIQEIRQFPLDEELFNNGNSVVTVRRAHRTWPLTPTVMT